MKKRTQMLGRENSSSIQARKKDIMQQKTMTLEAEKEITQITGDINSGGMLLGIVIRMLVPSMGIIYGPEVTKPNQPASSDVSPLVSPTVSWLTPGT